jgi:hypothetical protein
MKYLPEKFKTRKVRKRSCYTPCSRRRPKRREEPKEIVEPLTPPQRKRELEIKKYANTHFVNVVVEKSFYEEFKKTSSELGVSTEISMLKALEDYHEKMKKALELKKLEARASPNKLLI